MASGQVPAAGLRFPVALSKQVAQFSKGWSWHVWPFSWLEGALGTCPVQSGHGPPRPSMCAPALQRPWRCSSLPSTQLFSPVQGQLLPSAPGIMEEHVPLLTRCVSPFDDQPMCGAAAAPPLHQGFSNPLPIGLSPGSHPREEA